MFMNHRIVKKVTGLSCMQSILIAILTQLDAFRLDECKELLHSSFKWRLIYSGTVSQIWPQ